MKKDYQKQIEEISKILPRQMYEFKGRVKCIGSDVLLANIYEINGEKVDPEKEYIMNIPHRREVNHYLRIKRAFKKNGRIGIINYCKPFIKPEAFGKFQVLVFKTFHN